jgi:Arm DNA-binding domain
MGVITHRFVESVQPKSARTEYPDAGCPGLYLIVQPSGTRSWAFRFRHNGVNGKKTLGSAGEGGLSLAAARAAAASWRHKLEQGVAPVRRTDVTAVTAVTGKSDGGGDSIEAAAASFLGLASASSTGSFCRRGVGAPSTASASATSSTWSRASRSAGAAIWPIGRSELSRNSSTG